MASWTYANEDAARAAAERFHYNPVQDEASKAYTRLKGSEIAKRQLATEGWRNPPTEISSSLLDDLARPREVAPYRVQSLLGINHNASLTAQYKTGKTNLLCDLAGCLADGRPFLGQLAVKGPHGRIGFWNDEMDRDDFLDYFRPIGVIDQAKIVTAHLRGYRVPILTDIGMTGRWRGSSRTRSRSCSTTRGLGCAPGLGSVRTTTPGSLSSEKPSMRSSPGPGSPTSSRPSTPAGPSTTRAASTVEAQRRWMTGLTPGRC
jgi:hypothetical protein